MTSDSSLTLTTKLASDADIAMLRLSARIETEYLKHYRAGIGGHANSARSRLTVERSTTMPNDATKKPVARVALWITQIALAAMFLFAGGSKLAGAPAMVSLFAAIGWGQWFRYLTGAIELSAAVALLIPSAALFGALLLVPTMVGAAIANLFLGQSAAVPLVLLLLAAAVAWTRRYQLQADVRRLQP